jgi:hypothetical protein
MADARRAAFSFEIAALDIHRGRWIQHGRTYFYGSTGAPSAAGNCTALVVPQSFPRLARAAALPGTHQIVKSV